MTNTNALYQAVRRSGYLLRYVAQSLHLSYQGFLNKAKNKSEFTASEIQTLVALLKLSAEERDVIFFAAKVD